MAQNCDKSTEDLSLDLTNHEQSFLISKEEKKYDTIQKLEDSGFQSINEQLTKDPTRTLKTFGGVFTPVALAQFSTLLFLRIGFIIGSVGLYAGFGTLALAYAILLTTILSISAISTNGAIEGGGVYFMISRIFGPEFGGAIGTLFVCANIFGSALYCIGCIEGLLESFGDDAGKAAIVKVLPETSWDIIGYRSTLNALNFIICCIGAKMFTKTSVLLFFVVFTCTSSVLVSFVVKPGQLEVPFPDENTLHPNSSGLYTGLSLATLTENLYSMNATDYTTKLPVDFATVFSVIFSGLTGIMNGANMSGELRNPGFSIPVGTLSAVTFTFTTYCFLFVLTAATCSRYLLQNNYLFLMGVNVWAPFVVIGMTTATMSASLSKMIGSSRVLAAIVKDNLFGRCLSWLGIMSCGSNPLGSVVICALMIQCMIFIRHLNKIAKITSIFFLLSYSATNLACFCLEWASAPNFRPTFRYFSLWTALVGFLSNGAMMIVISPIYSLICIMLCLVLFIVLHLRAPLLKRDWGSISQAILYHQVRKFLLMLDPRKDHVKFWRPQILLLLSDPRFNCPLLDFINDIKKSGLYILGHVLVNDYSSNETDPAHPVYSKWMALVDHLKIKAFIEVTVAPSVRAGVQQLARIAGLGAMKPNTVVLGFCDNSTSQNFFLSECSPYYVDMVGAPASGAFESENARKRRNASDILREWGEGNSSRSRIEPAEFVGIIRDLLKMGKNVCICRYFYLLQKTTLLRRTIGEKQFVDVWPMNFFELREMNKENKSSMFCLQMATVLNMVPAWRKKTQLRVFLVVHSSDADILLKEKKMVYNLLKELRIEATIVVLSVDNVNLLRMWSPTGSYATANSGCTSSYTPIPSHGFTTSTPISLPTQRLSENYLKEVNLLIRENSINTAITFITLPSPLEDISKDNHYLKCLTTMTHGLPPTMLVHGLSSVTDSNI